MTPHPLNISRALAQPPPRGWRRSRPGIPGNMARAMQADEARAWSHSATAGALWESGLRLGRAIAAAQKITAAQNNCCAGTENVSDSSRCQSATPAPADPGNLDTENHTMKTPDSASKNPASASYEIVFDNGGGATLQTHDGKIAIHYDDMIQLAADATTIDNGETADGWDGCDPEYFITGEEYEKHASNGGYFALQLDPEYRHNWPDADETGWNNVAAFIRAMA